MIVKTKGIVLRTVKYSETSLILDLLTSELGLKTYIISGVRKKNARVNLGMLQPMNIIDIVAYNKESANINRIKEVKMEYVYQNLPFDIKKYSIGLFLIEIIGKSLKEKETNLDFFEFCKNSLIYLDQTNTNTSNFHLVFLIKMSDFLGFKPNSDYTTSSLYFDLREGKFIRNIPHYVDYLNERETNDLKLILNVDLENSSSLSFTREGKYKLLQNLILYYKIHLIDFGRIKTLEIFKSVFAPK